MFKKIFYITIAAFLGTTGCTKDPVNVSNGGAYNSSEYPKTLDDLTGLVGAGYGNLRNAAALYGWKLTPITFACSDHSVVPCFAFETGWTELTYNNVSVTNSYVNDTWSDFYVGVKTTNVALERADFYEKYYMKASEKQQVDYIRGEAHFLRALYYFYLECFYGESYITTAGGGEKMGVPLFKKVPSTLEDSKLPRSTVRETWDLIIDDLKTAATLLKGVQWPQKYTGRATEWSAKALLGKAYVFTQDWANAKTTLKDVIDNSGKSLLSYSNYKKAFNDINENNQNNNMEFNSESLFELNLDRVGDSYGIFSDVSPNTALTSIAGRLWSPACLGNDGTESGGDNVLGFCNEVVHDSNLVRFGFTLPAFTLVPNPAYTGSNPSPKNPQMIIDPVYKQKSLAFRTNKTTDPRLYVSALEPWIDSVGRESSIGYMQRKVARIPGAARPGFLAWSFRKYNTIDRTIYDHNNNDGANIYILRLADIYLLYAEACINSNEAATGLEYINKVHRRAYDQPINAASPYDYATLTSATKTGVTDVNLRNNPLRYERYAELFGEGHWWFDVCRWRIGSAEASFYGNLLPDNQPSKWDDKKSYKFPIPSNEINSNSKVANQQNPGY